MKKIALLALAGCLVVSKSPAISLDDIQIWTGSGTNRAALVIDWNTPEVFNYTTVPAPVANKTMVWGYRFNGAATGTQMLQAILAADPKLYVVADITFGTFVEAIGYNLNGTGLAGVSDGTVTNYFTNNFLTTATVNVDAAYPLKNGDLFWSGYYGPYWQLWNELGDSGGFLNSPNRGSSPYMDPNSYTQGQWASAYNGLDELPLTNGSWIGFSVSAAGYDSNTNDVAYDVFNNDEQAPPSPDGTYTAYVCNTNDFAVEVISTNNVDATSPYNDPTAILNRPTLRFIDPYDGGNTNHSTKIIDPPFNVTPDGSKVITEISKGGQITVKLGRKVYDDPGNPYGVDFIVYGNSFFSAFGGSGTASDSTDLNAVTLSSGYYGHAVIVSVSQDGTNWYTYNQTSGLFPDNAYRWDDTNDSWTAEEMNPTKPLDPAVYAANFSGQTVAAGLDQFGSAAGGTGFDLKESGFPWIQYVRLQAPTNAYSVIDAIAAADPVSVGDAQAITPADLTAGVTNLVFQSPADPSQNLVTLNFNSLSDIARINTAALNEFSAYAPVPGNVSGAYKIAVRNPTTDAAVAYSATAGLNAGLGYTGNGGDLRVYQWNCTNWVSLPFAFNPANSETIVSGLTNFSTLVVSQIVPPRLAIQDTTNGVACQFTPVPNCLHTLLRSNDLLTWTPVATVAPGSAQPVTLRDNTPPAGKAFYRLSVAVP